MPKTNNLVCQVFGAATTPPSITCIYPNENFNWEIELGIIGGQRAFKGLELPTTGWNNTIRSVNTSNIGSPDSFALRFQVGEINGSVPLMLGLGTNETSDSYQDIEYAFYIFQSVTGDYSRIYVFENGVNRGLYFTGGIGEVNGKKLEIVNDNGEVKYYIDGAEVYTSTVTASGDYYLDSSWYYNATTWNGTGLIDNIEICTL